MMKRQGDSMRERLQRFMVGRYGADDLSKVTNICVIVCLVFSAFSGWVPVLGVFYWIGLVLFAFNCYRMFSRDVSKRYRENQKFCNIRYKAVVRRDRMKKRWQQRNIYRFYKCPQCRQMVRVPKGRGKICITCPKCRTEFVKKS